MLDITFFHSLFCTASYLDKDKQSGKQYLSIADNLIFISQDKWTYEPFSAHKTENGDIFARGSQVCVTNY